jgi:hypothetical protein
MGTSPSALLSQRLGLKSFHPIFHIVWHQALYVPFGHNESLSPPHLMNPGKESPSLQGSVSEMREEPVDMQGHNLFRQ